MNEEEMVTGNMNRYLELGLIVTGSAAGLAGTVIMGTVGALGLIIILTPPLLYRKIEKLGNNACRYLSNNKTYQ